MEWWHHLIGYQNEQLALHQMVVRGVILFFLALLFIRVFGNRTIGKNTIFDNITTLMVAAILARAIVTHQPFGATLVVVMVLLALHRLTAWITFRSHTVGKIIKGEPLLLVKDGKVQWKNLSRSHITVRDIEETMRLEGKSAEIETIKECYLERSGRISIVMEQ
jgi:uncharacterized membrane protein YcaP (DUF421 family)